MPFSDPGCCASRSEDFFAASFKQSRQRHGNFKALSDMHGDAGPFEVLRGCRRSHAGTGCTAASLRTVSTVMSSSCPKSFAASAT